MSKLEKNGPLIVGVALGFLIWWSRRKRAAMPQTRPGFEGPGIMGPPV